MSPQLPLAVLVLLLAPPAVVFYLVVESSRRRLLASLHSADDVERVLARKPWYVSRGQLVAWEYLLLEAAASGQPKPHRHLTRVGPTGRRLWVLWQGAQPTLLFHPWTSAAVFALGGLVIVLPTYRSGARGLALAEAAAMFILCSYLLATARLQRTDDDWRLGARMRPLLSADPHTRLAGLHELVPARATVEPEPAAA